MAKPQVEDALQRARCATTRPARSITTSSPRCTNRCAIAIPMPHSTGSCGCSKAAKTACTLLAASCAWPLRTSRSPTRTRWKIAIAAKRRHRLPGHAGRRLALAQAAVYLSIAPKSNALYKAYGAVKRDVEETAADPVPLHLRNAPTKLMKELGYGEGYQYAHDSRRRSRRWSACRRTFASGAGISHRRGRGEANPRTPGTTRSRPKGRS